MSSAATDASALRTPLRRIDAIFGGPVWWGAHLAAMYWLVPRACEWNATWMLHLVTLVFATLCGRAALSAVQVLRGGRAAERQATGRRDVYLGVIGVALAVFFGAVVVAEWLPALMIGPCL